MKSGLSTALRTSWSGRLPCSLLFFGGGIGLGAWAACLPALSAQLMLDKNELGQILLFFALGAIITMTIAGRLTAKVPPTLLSLVGALVFGTILMVIPFLPTKGLLALCVCIGGMGFGALDVSMNTEASNLERSISRRLMSSFHGTYSVGNVAGALIVGYLLFHGSDLALCLGIAGAMVVVLSLIAFYIERCSAVTPSASGQDVNDTGRLRRAQLMRLYLLGFVAFLAFFAEGALLDWSAVYLVDTTRASESTGAYAFAVFAGAIAIGRLLGDAVAERLGTVRLIALGSLSCAVTLSAMLIMKDPVFTFPMLAICGLGIANIVPALFAAAGRAGGATPGRAMSIVTTLAYAGLLCGPALLGFVAHSYSLTVSLSIVVITFAMIAAATRTISKSASDE